MVAGEVGGGFQEETFDFVGAAEVLATDGDVGGYDSTQEKGYLGTVGTRCAAFRSPGEIWAILPAEIVPADLLCWLTVPETRPRKSTGE
jgi:hypothetical protein